MLKHIYEHLKTRKKYNTLMVKYESLKEELEQKITEYNQLKRQMLIQQNVWETRVIELEQKLSKRGNKNVPKSMPKNTKISRRKQDNNK